jgi:hypothetical protein
MAERHKLEPAYDPADWRDAETGDSGDDPLAELARLVQGIEKNPGSKPLRPAPPRSESSTRPQPAMRYESYPSSPQAEPDPYLRAAPVDRTPSTAELASDLEAELLRELQASFNAVRAPIESFKPPEAQASNYDEVDFDAFAEVHFRKHAPMEAAPPPPQPRTGIESLANWRDQTRPRPRQGGPSFRQRLAEGAAESSAPLRTSAEIRYEPDPLAADPEIAAVAAAAESFSNPPPERVQPAPVAYDHAAEENYAYVPGYAPHVHAHEEDEYEIRSSSGRRPLMLVGGLLGIVLIGAIGFFVVTNFIGGESGPPPLIAADSGPIKVRPENPGGSASSDQSKLIYDRVGGGDTANTELAADNTVTTVSRPETQQTEASREISRIILPDPTDPPVEDEPVAASDDTEAVGPKRVRTVVVRPDGTIVSSTSAPADPAPQTAAPVETAAPQVAASAPRVVETAPVAREPVSTAMAPEEPAVAEEPDELGFADDWENENAPAADNEPVGATTTRTTGGAADKTGPISLLPKSGGTPSGATPNEPARVAAVEPVAKKPVAAEKPVAEKPAAVATGSYFVQVSSQRSEAAALAAYREVQRRFPGVLGSRDADIQRADLGSRGVYYRARVAPGLSGSEAVSLCTSLKNAGGDCIITQN